MHIERLTRFYSFFLGFTAISLQIVLMREIFVIFYGNELSFGFFLGVWMGWFAAGSWLGHFGAGRFRFVTLQQLTFLGTIGALVLLKFIRPIFNVPYGEMLSFSELIFAIVLVLALPCLLLGMQFSSASGLLRREVNPSAIVYIFESAGSVVASLAATFILVHYFENLPALLLVALFSRMGVILVERRLSLGGALFMVAVLSLFSFSSKLTTRLHQTYWKTVDSNFELSRHGFSKYGHSSIVSIDGQPVLYYNGVKQSAVPDLPAAQQEAALVLSQLETNGTLLLLGSGANGLSAELARSGNRIITVDLDESAFQLVNSILKKEPSLIRPSGSVENHFGDARVFLKNQPDSSFDCIVLNQGSPSSSLINRFYTCEFFRLVAQKIRRDGIFVILNFPSAENFWGPELAGLNKTLLNTLKAVFKHTLALPGESAVFFAGNGITPEWNLDTLKERVSGYAEKAMFFHPAMIDYLYDPYRISQFNSAIESASSQINTDMKPICYLYDFMYWNKIFRSYPRMSAILLALNRAEITGFLILPVLAWTLFVLLRGKSRRVLFLSGFTTIIGFCAITLNILLILIFQTAFGYIFEWIGLALAAFMAGMTIGAGLANYSVLRREPGKYLVGLSVVLIITLLFFPTMASLIRSQQSLVVFFLISFWSGGLTGGAFPLLNRLYLNRNPQANVGAIYAWDLVGGALGSFLVSGLLVPLFGFEFPIHICILLLAFGTLLLLKTKL